MRIVKIFIVLMFCANYCAAQSDKKAFFIKTHFGIGLTAHPKLSFEFPIGYSDASRTLKQHDSKVGYHVSLMGLKALNNYLSIGLISTISKFGFTEIGEELSFWGNHTHEYRIDREFKLFGLGVTAGIDVLKSKKRKLSIYTGMRYEDYFPNEGSSLPYGYSTGLKFALDNSIEYNHLIAKNIYFTMGLSSTFSLKELYTKTNYKPIRYGVLFGLNFEID